MTQRARTGSERQPNVAPSDADVQRVQPTWPAQLHGLLGTGTGTADGTTLAALAFT